MRHRLIAVMKGTAKERRAWQLVQAGGLGICSLLSQSKKKQK